MRKLLSLFLTTLMVFLAITPAGMPVFAAEDTTPPVLKSIEVLTTSVKVGDPIKVKIEVEETGTGLSDALIQLNSGSGSGVNTSMLYGEKTWSTPVYSTDSQYISYTFSIPTESNTVNADWFVGYLELTDKKGNYARFYGSADNNTMHSEYLDPGVTVNGITHCTTTGSTVDSVPPVINWVKFKTDTIEKPGNAVLSVNMTESSGVGYYQFTFFNTRDESIFTVNNHITSHQKGTFTEDYKIYFDSNKHNGEWILDGIMINDAAGNQVSYTGVDHDHLANSEDPNEIISNARITVRGVKGDETKPEVNSISISDADRTVLKPGKLTFDLDITEADSGVTNFEVQINRISSGEPDINSRTSYMFYAKGYGDPEVMYNANGRVITKKEYSAPLFTGKYTFTVPISAYVQNGEYSIYVCQMTDKADNTYSDGMWDDPLCSATFNVEDEFDYDFEMSISNPSLLSAVKNMDAGKVGRVLLDDKTSNNKVSKAVIDAIAGVDKKLVFYRSGYQWIMDGTQFDKAKTKDLDLNVKFTTIEAENLSSNQKALCLTFSNNGELPGVIQFRFKSSFVEKYEDDPDSLHLYYVDNGEDDPSTIEDNEGIDYANDTLDEISKPNFDVIIDDHDAWCYVDISHNSKYLVSGAKITSFKKTSMSKVKVTGISKKYVHTGKAIKPKPTLKLNNKTLKPGTDYTISYKNNKKIGTAKLIIKGKTIDGSKTISFKIVPKGTKIVKVRGAKKGFTVKWKKQKKQTSGYQIQYSLNKKFKKSKVLTIRKNKTVSKEIKKLKGNKKYHIRIRTYKTVKGKKYCSAWSKPWTVKTRK